MNKLTFFIVFLSALPISAYALTINAQPTTQCDLTYCKTCVNLKSYLNAAQLNFVKSADFSSRMIKSVSMSYNFVNDTICLTGNIKPQSSNYWLLNLTYLTIDPWWNSSWLYRINQSIYSTVATNEILPRNTTLNTATLVTAGMNANCSDLRIANESGLSIPFYIEGGCNNAATIIWYKTTTKADNTSMIFAYWGNPSAPDGQDMNGVFDANYKVAYDMAVGTGTTVFDATSNKNNATLTGAVFTNGFFGNGTAYDGADDVGKSGNVGNGETALTLEGWALMTNASSLGAVISKGLTTATRVIEIFKYNDNPCLNLLDADLFGSTEERFACYNEFPTARWIYLVARWNGTYIDAFLNGTLVTSTWAINTSNKDTGIQMARMGDGAWWYGGLLDNVRYSNSARTNNNIRMVYDTATKVLSGSWSASQQNYTPTSIILYLNGTTTNITAYSGDAVNMTAKANATMTVSLYVNGTLSGTSTNGTVQNISVFTANGLYNITAHASESGGTQPSTATSWLSIITRAKADMNMNVCFHIKPVCVDTGTNKLYINGNPT